MRLGACSDGITNLCRKTSPNDNRTARERERNLLVWNKTEELLKPAEADVLEIFDWYVDCMSRKLSADPVN